VAAYVRNDSNYRQEQTIQTLRRDDASWQNQGWEDWKIPA